VSAAAVIVAGVVPGAIVAAMAGGAGTEAPAVVAGPVVAAVARGVGPHGAAAVVVTRVMARRIVGAVTRLRHSRGAEGTERQRGDRSREDQLVACSAHMKHLLS
jgi:hypothetical protein